MEALEAQACGSKMSVTERRARAGGRPRALGLRRTPGTVHGEVQVAADVDGGTSVRVYEQQGGASRKRAHDERVPRERGTNCNACSARRLCIVC